MEHPDSLGSLSRELIDRLRTITKPDGKVEIGAAYEMLASVLDRERIKQSGHDQRVFAAFSRAIRGELLDVTTVPKEELVLAVETALLMAMGLIALWAADQAKSN